MKRTSGERLSPERILIDTGPLVAILSRDDTHHEACVAVLHEIRGPLFSCWPVITEAAWLLRRSPRVVQQLLGGTDAGFQELFPLSGKEATAISAVMKKCEGLRPQLADAALVYLAAREGIETIFTLDRQDFSVHRTRKRRAFRLIPQVSKARR